MIIHLIIVTVTVITITSLFLERNKLQKRYREEIDALLQGFEKEKKAVRQDARKRSGAVQWGLSIENFVPFMDEFPIPTEDVTFLGKPIDYVGYTNTDSKDQCEVHFIEVKSGRSQLMKHQRNIKEAIKAGRVYWHEIRVDSNRKV